MSASATQGGHNNKSYVTLTRSVSEMVASLTYADVTAVGVIT